ncbi:uncharacterized protein ACB057_008380 [Neosynchiropus ocellatus]
MCSQVCHNHHEDAYMALMKGLRELDLRGAAVPSSLVLIGDHAFPLAMNSTGQVVMAASLYGCGRIVALGHEAYLTAVPGFIDNALTWLRGDKSDNMSVGVHKSVLAVAKNLSKSHFEAKVVEGFDSSLKLDVYVTDSDSVNANELVGFLKEGGGVLIAGEAWSWAAKHPKDNTLLLFPGNKVSGVTGIYFSEHKGAAECIPVYPHIPSTWMDSVIGKNFEDDLEFLLEGVENFDLQGRVICSEVMVHGRLAFPIGTTPDGRSFLAGAYYGQGRIIVVTHEGLLARASLFQFWKNALHWLDEGRNGLVGILSSRNLKLLGKCGLKCEITALKKELSVYVVPSTIFSKPEDVLTYVAEGGGLLVAGHAWNWAQKRRGHNVLTEFPGNKLLNKVGLSMLGSTIGGGLYKTPEPSKALTDYYHFHHLLHRFAAHVKKGENLTKREEACLTKLGTDCATYLHMQAHDCCSYTQVVSVLTEVLKTSGIPPVNAKCPVKAPKDHLLLSVVATVYKYSPYQDELLPYLIKDIEPVAVVYNQKVQISVKTGGRGEWVSTGLYLANGMKTYIAVPPELVNKGWLIQIGCQTDCLKAGPLKRAPCVYERFPVTSEMIQVNNLWGGLIYLIAPAKTKVHGVEVTVQMAVQAPYYKSGVTSAADWELLRNAPAPWAELEFENIILTVPSSVVRNLERPDLLAAHWDKIMRAIADLSSTPHKFARKERFVTDVQISHGLMHAGYPIMTHRHTAAQLVSVDYMMTKGLWGPIHELGHNQQRGCWELKPHTTEGTCNLWSVYVHEEVFGIQRDKAHQAIFPAKRKCRRDVYVKGGRKLKTWTMWCALETYLELQEKFGWDGLKKTFGAYYKMSTFPRDNKGKMSLYALTFSQAVGVNVCGFLKAWGWVIDPATEKKLSSLPEWTDHPMADYKRADLHTCLPQSCSKSDWTESLDCLIMSSQHVQAYSSLMKGLTELDISGPYVPSVLDLVGDRAFPLAMNSHGQILMAASVYGSGRIVVLGHEGFLTAFPTLTENAVAWLKGDGPDNRPVGVQKTIKAVVDSLSKSCGPTKVLDGFDKNLELGVFVTNADSVSGKEEDLVEFLRGGGGVLIAGHAVTAPQKNPAENTKFHFAGNSVTSVAGIYVTQHPAVVEQLPVYPQIPSSWKSLAVRHSSEDDLEVLLQGISEFDLVTSNVPSELLVHGPRAFPIAATEGGQTFLAGAHYGKGRVVVIGQEGLLGVESLVPFWKNALTWLDRGRDGTIGVVPTLARVHSLYTNSDIKCQQTEFNRDLSVFVCKAYVDEEKMMELQEFVAEGGGLLLGGQGWYWAHANRKKNVLTEFPANKFLYNMGLSLLARMIPKGVYKAPHPSRDIREAYHLRHMIHHFTAHVTQGTDLTQHEEANLKKLGSDSAFFLQMKAHHCASYSQLLDVITDVVKTCGIPQVTESSPVSTAKDHALLHLGAGLYRAHPSRDTLLPHLIKDIPSLPVVNNYKVIVDADTTGGEEWISTGLYLSPGMETTVVVPEQIVNKGWEIQIGAQADALTKDLLKRPPRVCVRFPVTARETEVYNLYGGLIYLVAPHQTQMSQLEVTVEVAVLAPYYKFGVTTAADWSELRSAPAPWAELEFDNIVLTVPSGVVRELEKPEELAAHWNSIMKAIADLAVIPTKFLRKERFVTDVQISHGLMHAGYPIMSHQPTAAQLVSIDHMMSKGLWGPIHELGHNQQRGCWEFKPHTTEGTCNIWTVYVHEEVFKIPRARAYPGLTPEKRKALLEQHVKKGRRLEDWSVFVALETYLQLQEKFGWDAVKKVFAAYHDMTRFPADNQGKMNLYAETFSQVVEMNLCQFFKAWSWPIDPMTEEKLCHLPAWTDHPMVHYD